VPLYVMRPRVSGLNLACLLMQLSCAAMCGSLLAVHPGHVGIGRCLCFELR